MSQQQPAGSSPGAHQAGSSPGAQAGGEVARTRDPVSRAFEILRTMVDEGQEAYGVRELAQTVGIPPSSAHRLLGLLENTGMVSREVGGTYSLGMEFHRLAMRGASQLPLGRAAVEVLAAIRDECGETSVLGLYDRHRRQMMFAQSLESASPLRYVLEMNTWVPVYAGATGLAIMAFLSEDEQEAIIAETQLAPLTARTTEDPKRLRRELARIRKRGYAFTRGERVAGAVGFASPIFDGQERVIGDVIVTLPEFRFENLHSEQELSALVVRGAKDLTERIGGRHPAR